MDLPIVVGVDGSGSGLRAVDWAADDAALRGASLRLVYASLWERYEGVSLAQGPDRPSEQVMAEDVVGTAERRALGRQPGVKVTVDVLPEDPEYALLRESRGALSLVLGRRARGGMTEALLGSLSETVAGHAQCPVIVVRGGPEGRAPAGARRCVVLGVGERAEGLAAVRFAAEEAVLRGVPLEAVRAWHRTAHVLAGRPTTAGEQARPHQEEAAEALREVLRDTPAGLEVHLRTVEGRARDALPVVSRGADLLVVGGRRRPVRFGSRGGRVAHGVLHHAACPVAVVPA